MSSSMAAPYPCRDRLTRMVKRAVAILVAVVVGWRRVVRAASGCSRARIEPVRRRRRTRAGVDDAAVRALRAVAAAVASIAMPASARTLAVPLDYDRPGGRRITLAVARKPTAPRRREDREPAREPRGAGRARCRHRPTYVASQLPTADHGPVRHRGLGSARDRGERTRGLRSAARLPLRCRHGARRSRRAARARSLRRNASSTPASAAVAISCAHISTASTVQDLERLRSALGDDELNYLGLSYGTVHRRPVRREIPDGSPRAGARRRRRPLGAG